MGGQHKCNVIVILHLWLKIKIPYFTRRGREEIYMAKTPVKYSSGVSFGTRVALTDNVDKVVDTDGYVRLTLSANVANAQCTGYINGTAMFLIATGTNPPTSTQYFTTFVKAGMTIKYHGTSGASEGYFYPLA